MDCVAWAWEPMVAWRGLGVPGGLILSVCFFLMWWRALVVVYSVKNPVGWVVGDAESAFLFSDELVVECEVSLRRERLFFDGGTSIALRGGV